MGTTIPAALANLADGLALRSTLIGPPKVAIHTIDFGDWTDSEAIVFGQITAPQSWSMMMDPGRDETATLSGYVFTQLAGGDETKIRAARTRAGVILDELASQLAADPDLGGAVPETFAPPLLTQATWLLWAADQDGTAILRVRIDWQATWAAAL
jgi:hypothetical protein